MMSLKIDKLQISSNHQIKSLVNNTRYTIYQVVIEVFTDVRLEFHLHINAFIFVLDLINDIFWMRVSDLTMEVYKNFSQMNQF